MVWFTSFFQTRQQMISELANSIASASISKVSRLVAREQISMSVSEFRGYLRARAAKSVHACIDALTGIEATFAAKNRTQLVAQSVEALLQSEAFHLKATADSVNSSEIPFAKAA